VDDEFDLLRDAPGPTPPRRPMWLLLGALVLVALLAVVGVVWMVSSVSDRGGRVTAAASSAASSPAAPATPPATSEPVPTTVPPLPSTTAAVPTATIPVLSATVAPPPTPKPTTKPAPKPTPVPRPTLSRPAGKLVAVPDVVGLRVQPATSVLTAAGLKVQVLGGVLVVDRDQRRVTAQRPTPGTFVRAGSTVILVTDGL
jgi:hypothetical protein